MSLESERLRARGADVWATAVAHPMVDEIGAGTLPHKTFRFYFEQNVQYLYQYVRAVGLGVVAAPDLDSQATLARFLGQLVDVEIPANIRFLEHLGGSMNHLPEPLPTTRAYAAHLMKAAGSGNLAVTLSAVLPCQWSYGEIGQRLVTKIPDDPVYADWIGMFATDGYDELVRASTDLLDRWCTDDDQAATSEAFDRSTRFELAFWDMAYAGGEAVPRLEEAVTPVSAAR